MTLIITAQTTDEQIQAGIRSAHARLQQVIAKTDDAPAYVGHIFVRAAQEVRDADEVARAQHQYRDCVGTGNEMWYLFDIIARTDDTWSGRGNDSTRSAHDAVTAWAREQVRDLQRQQREAARSVVR